MSPRIVMHVDMDAFYASVELRRRPELRGTAVIVGGSPRGGVIGDVRGESAWRTVRHVVDRGEASGTARYLRRSRLRQLQRGVQGDRGCLPVSCLCG